MILLWRMAGMDGNKTGKATHGHRAAMKVEKINRTDGTTLHAGYSNMINLQVNTRTATRTRHPTMIRVVILRKLSTILRRKVVTIKVVQAK